MIFLTYHCLLSYRRLLITELDMYEIYKIKKEEDIFIILIVTSKQCLQ